jgi:hypothetical protein
MIEVISPTRIEVDGKDAGLPLEYYLNNPADRVAVQASFVAWHQSHVIAEQNRQAQVAAALVEAQASITAAQTDADDRVAAIQADMEVLGTKEEAQTLRKVQEVTKLQAEIAAKKAELEAKSAELSEAGIAVP